MKRLISALAALALATASYAQNVPLQGGPWTAGHSPMFSISGGSQPVIQDSGTAAGGAAGIGLSELLQVSRAGNGVNTAPYANSGSGPLNTHTCLYDAPTTNSTGYHYLCLDANAQGGGLITYGPGGGASPLPFVFNINGINWSFGGGFTSVPASSITGQVSVAQGGTGFGTANAGFNALSPMTTAGDTIYGGVNGAATRLPVGTNSQVYVGGQIPSWGFVPAAALLGPQSAAFGGTLSFTCSAHQWANAMAATTGAWTCTQPAFSDISGQIAASQIPLGTGLTTSGGNLILANPSASTLGGIKSYAAVTSQWINSISTAGAPSSTQPAFTDISGQATLAQLPTIANSTALGNVSGGSSTPTALTATQLTTLCNVATTSLSGCTPALSGNTSSFYRGDGTFALPPGAATGVITAQSLTGSGTYTPTAGTLAIRVRMVGAGGGGAAAVTNNGSAGGPTTFGSWTALGGGGGVVNGAPGAGGAGGVNGTGTLIQRRQGGQGGPGLSSPAWGGYGGASALGPQIPSPAGAGFAIAGLSAPANSGSGGSGGQTATAGQVGSGGGSGESVEFTVSAPGATAYSVGALGAGGPAGTQAGGNGATGVILVEEFH